jgi:hypothetical protein
MEWATVLPNLSIGVVSVLALGYITLQFLVTLDKRAKAHEEAMTERETALRAVEKEIRTELVGALKESNLVIAENSKVMQRLVHHMDQH